MFFAPAQALTSSPLTIASPPALRMSATVCAASEASRPVPSTFAPRSLTTTFAPLAASMSACSRPIPRPAPVTIATRPSQIPAIAPPRKAYFRSG